MRDSTTPQGWTTLVVDDEALARRRVVEMLHRRDDVQVVGECANGREAVEAIRRLEPDILFLDVQMPGLDGFQVLERLGPQELPAVIFSTAYDEYALAAFDVHAVDYLLKPYADERLEQALERAESLLRARRLGELRERLRALLDDVSVPRTSDADRQSADPGGPSPDTGYLERFAVPGRKGITLVDAEEVDWIEASGDYATLHEGRTTHLLRTTMTELQRALDPRAFLRIHRSAIVRIARVRRLRSDDHGDYVAVLDDGRELRVGRTYRDDVLHRLGLRT